MTYVLLHGFTGGPESFDALGLEDAIAPRLAGHGPEPILARSWDEEIDRLLASIDVKNAHLVGYSFGGRLAYHLLLRAPERFSRATLIGAHPGLHDPRAREARRRADRKWIELLLRDGLEAFVTAWEALPLWSTQTPAQIEAQRALRRSHTAYGLANALAVLGLGEMPPIDPSAIRVPVRAIFGAHDPSLAPHPAPLIIPGAGHNVLIERPEALAL
jgi:2-succinyl-6-hydroxy-2,4-cyclohexadiene-1-carboxylate synthase